MPDYYIQEVIYRHLLLYDIYNLSRKQVFCLHVIASTVALDFIMLFTYSVDKTYMLHGTAIVYLKNNTVTDCFTILYMYVQR
jgi:hypothetical protein